MDFWPESGCMEAMMADRKSRMPDGRSLTAGVRQADVRACPHGHLPGGKVFRYPVRLLSNICRIIRKSF